MNRHRKKHPIAMQLGSILLLTLWIAVSTGAQTLATAPDDRSETPRALTLASHFRFSFAPSRPMLAYSAPTDVEKAISKALVRAWRIAGDGTYEREGVVLIFRMEDGSFAGQVLGITNEYRKFTFRWNPAVLAIVHTHPNSSDPQPGEQDRRVADKYGVLNFTISIRGMYVYDPATKQTTKVLNGLDWLNPSTYPDELKGWLGE